MIITLDIFLEDQTLHGCFHKRHDRLLEAVFRQGVDRGQRAVRTGVLGFTWVEVVSSTGDEQLPVLFGMPARISPCRSKLASGRHTWHRNLASRLH